MKFQSKSTHRRLSFKKMASILSRSQCVNSVCVFIQYTEIWQSTYASPLQYVCWAQGFHKIVFPLFDNAFYLCCTKRLVLLCIQQNLEIEATTTRCAFFISNISMKQTGSINIEYVIWSNRRLQMPRCHRTMEGSVMLALTVSFGRSCKYNICGLKSLWGQ